MSWLHAFYPGEPVILSVGVYLAQMTLLLAVGLSAGRWFRWEAATRHHILLVTWLSVLATPLFSWGLSASNTSTAFQEKLRSGYAAITRHAESTAAHAPPSIPPAQNATSGFPLPVETSAFPYDAFFSLLGLGWIAGVLVVSARLSGSARKLACIKKRSIPVRTDHPLRDACRSAAKNVGASRTPEIRLSNECNSPVVIGLSRPALLFPERLLGTLSGDALRHVLEHEMAHVARRDYLVLWLQHAFAALFWFHPLVHLFNRQLAQVREELCDNHVLKSAQETEYGYTLLSVAEALGGITPPQPAVGLLTVNWSLESRIAQILHHRRKTMTRVSLQHACITSLGALAMTSTLALCYPAMAGDAGDAKVRRVAVEIRPTEENAKEAKPHFFFKKEGEAIVERRVIRVGESGPANIVITKDKNGIASIEIRSDEGAFVMNDLGKLQHPKHPDLLEHAKVVIHSEAAKHSKVPKAVVVAEIAKAKEHLALKHREFKLRQKELQHKKEILEQELLVAQNQLREAERELAAQQESLDAATKALDSQTDPFEGKGAQSDPFE